MRKITLIAGAIALIALTSWKVVSKKNVAEVESVDGYYIFMKSKPTSNYEVIGNVQKKGAVWNGKPEEMFNIIVRRAKKEYPKCDGIIFTNIDMDEAQCIRFTE